MNKKFRALLFVAPFCLGIANATSTTPAICLPGATVNSTGAGSTPPLTGSATCPAFNAPAGNVVTSVVLGIEGDMESPDGAGTFTYNFTVTSLSLVSGLTEVITATGFTAGPFNWTVLPGDCVAGTGAAANSATCTVPVSGSTVPAITVNASGAWTAGSGGLLTNGAETFNVTVVYNYAPTPSASCAVITAVQGVAITPVALTGTGGAGGPYTFSASGLPNGLSISSSGVISGTPTVNGTFPYTVTITDSAGNPGTINCSVTVNPPEGASCVVITAVDNVAITPVTLVGSGGAGGPYTFSATGLPNGLTMSSNGTISGTPTVTGTFPYTVTIADSAGNKSTVNCSVTVTQPTPPTANCASISAVKGEAITPITVTGSGGAGPPYTFSATGLPAGLTMSSSGTISGTPTVSGTFPYTVTVTDSAGNQGTVNCSVTVLTTPPPPGSCFFVSYAANLSVGESYINMINNGAGGAPPLGPGYGTAAGNICVNVYAFDPQEEEISCCSCLLTPNSIANLGVNRDLLGNTLTGAVPTSVVIKLVCTLAGGDGTGTNCNQNAGAEGFQTPALVALGTTLQPVGTGYSVVEHVFTRSTLSSGEYASITGRCASMMGNGSGYGICASCRSGALGAAHQ